MGLQPLGALTANVKRPTAPRRRVGEQFACNRSAHKSNARLQRPTGKRRTCPNSGSAPSPPPHWCNIPLRARCPRPVPEAAVPFFLDTWVETHGGPRASALRRHNTLPRRAWALEITCSMSIAPPHTYQLHRKASPTNTYETGSRLRLEAALSICTTWLSSTAIHKMALASVSAAYPSEPHTQHTRSLLHVRSASREHGICTRGDAQPRLQCIGRRPKADPSYEAAAWPCARSLVLVSSKACRDAGLPTQALAAGRNVYRPSAKSRDESAAHNRTRVYDAMCGWMNG